MLRSPAKHYKLCYVLAVICTVVSLCIGSSGHPLLSDLAFCLTLLLLIPGFAGFYSSHKRDSSHIAELTFCYGPFALFWVLATLSSKLTITPRTCLVAVLGFLAFCVPLVIMVVSLISSASWKGVKTWLKNHVPMIILIILFIFFSIETLWDLALCDSFLYFDASEKATLWNFSLRNPELFKMCTHHSYSVALWYSIGAYLTPGDPAGERLINIALICISIILLYTLLRKSRSFSRWNNIAITTSVAVVILNPLILGTVYEITTSNPEIAFFLWVIASIFLKRKILFSFSAFSLTFCKENDAVLMAGLLFGLLLGCLIQACKNKSSLKDELREYANIIFCIFLALVCFTVLFIATPRWMVGSEAASAATSAGMNVFELNADNIIAKLKEIFIMNFSWVFVLIIILATLVWFIRYAQGKHGAHGKNRLHQAKASNIPTGFALAGAAIAFLAFQFAFLTYVNPRYVTLGPAALSLGSVYALSYLCHNKIKTYMISVSALAILMLAQSFFTVDPLTLRSFKNIDTGEGTIITTRTFYQDQNGRTTDPQFTSKRELLHGASYNRQNIYLGRALEKLLATIDYSSDTLVILDPIYDKFGTYITFLGKWHSDKDAYYYDSSTRQIKQLNGKESLNIKVASPDKPLDMEKYDNYQRVFFVSADFRKEFTTLVPLEGVQIIDEGKIEYRSWVLNYYQIK